MTEEILPNLYKIEVPLPRNPLKAINSYIIKGQGQFLIIDTGMNRKECISVMSAGLKELDVFKEDRFFYYPLTRRPSRSCFKSGYGYINSLL